MTGPVQSPPSYPFDPSSYPPPGAGNGAWPAAFRALGHPNYRVLWFGQLFSLTGAWMIQTAVGWLVYLVTQSAFLVSLVATAKFLPLMLLAPFAGVVTDRTNKKRLITAAQGIFMLLAAVLAWLTVTGAVRYWHIMVVALLVGLTETFEKPARQALLIDLVGRADLMNAIALHATLFNFTRFLGPVAAAFIIASAGESLVFAIAALSFLPLIFGLAVIRVEIPIRLKIPSHSLGELREGLRFALSDRPTFSLLTITALIAFLGLPHIALMPVFAGEVFQSGPEGLGALFAASGIGSVVGGITLAMLGNVRRKGRLVTGGMFVFTLALIGFSFSRLLLLSLATLVLLGWARLMIVATANTLLQTLTPDKLRGRVLGLFLWVWGGGMVLGSLIFGALAQRWGAPQAVLAGAMTFGLSAIIITWRWPELRALDDQPTNAAVNAG